MKLSAKRLALLALLLLMLAEVVARISGVVNFRCMTWMTGSGLCTFTTYIAHHGALDEPLNRCLPSSVRRPPSPLNLKSPPTSIRSCGPMKV